MLNLLDYTGLNTSAKSPDLVFSDPVPIAPTRDNVYGMYASESLYEILRGHV